VASAARNVGSRAVSLRACVWVFVTHRGQLDGNRTSEGSVMVEYFFFGFLVGQVIGPDVDREARLWSEHEARVCAAAGDTNPQHNLRDCVTGEMERKRKAMQADLNAGSWKGMKQ
jgi:hypothetical protein